MKEISFQRVTISDIPSDESIAFVCDSQEVEIAKDNIFQQIILDFGFVGGTPIPKGLKEELADFESFFLQIGEGEYTAVWGLYNTVPFMSDTAWRIF